MYYFPYSPSSLPSGLSGLDLNDLQIPSLEEIWNTYDQTIGLNKSGVDRANWEFHIAFLIFKQIVIVQVSN